ncbi:hypothetical protein MZM54_03070 [[Brevibacterium] frigoritolerans]|nr:hypothetical protein [Peribacillus frigoritolerans]
MRVNFEAFCEKCKEKYLSSRPLPIEVEKMECGICEEVGTSKITKIIKTN